MQCVVGFYFEDRYIIGGCGYTKFGFLKVLEQDEFAVSKYCLGDSRGYVGKGKDVILDIVT